MSVTNHERPGVYSRYDASTVVKGRGGGGCVGLAALCGTGTAGTLYTFNRYEEAVTAFGGEETLTELVRLLFLNGAAQWPKRRATRRPFRCWKRRRTSQWWCATAAS